MQKGSSQLPLIDRATMLGSPCMMQSDPQATRPPAKLTQPPRTPRHRSTRSGAKAAKHQLPMLQRSSRQTAQQRLDEAATAGTASDAAHGAAPGAAAVGDATRDPLSPETLQVEDVAH